MVHLGRPNKIWGFLLGLWFAAPALAHTVKVSGDVAATFHIAPNHNPKVGQQSQAWIALTQRGGKVIPLTQCKCRLKVYLNPHREEDTPTLAPVLKPISTEHYQNIPSAEITFPQSGEYELEIAGTPQAGAKFQPFKLSYEVTVMAGPIASETIAQLKPSPQPARATPTATPQKVEAIQFAGASRNFIGLTLAVAGLAAIGYALGRKKK
jgi:hypothetical protein